MSYARDLLVLHPDPETGEWVVGNDCEIGGVRIPAGYRTDLASVPRLLWFLVGHPAHPRVAGPAVKHDWLYETGQFSRAEADRQFRRDLRDYGAQWPCIYWLGVRLGGWLSWGKCRARSVRA